jgi:hypothetical protein
MNWQPTVIAAAILLILSALIGYNIGWKHGATEAQMITLTEIKRQCESPFPLLLGDTFYSCRANGVVIR